ncbi:MAG: hypothetical protein ACKVP3_18305 [Hyphomicrobiaceae bacterium]
MFEMSPRDAFCGTANEGAALGLLALMTGISEEAWCAGWMQDLERELWQAPPGKLYGRIIITERRSALLRLLSEEANGWWVYRDEPTFLTLAEWKASL